jgi:hypothetical protein
LRYLSSPGLPARVSTKEIGGHFGRPWREVSGDITGHRSFDTLLHNAGWSYVGKRGSTGAFFERLEGALPTEEELGVCRRRLIELLRLKQDDVGVLRPQAEQSLDEPRGPGACG